MKKASIIGFGRFGELLAKLAFPIFDISIIDSSDERLNAAKQLGYCVSTLNDAVESDFIFLAVPISQIESTLVKLGPLLSKDQVVIDICSVKVYPTNLMKQYVPKAQIIGTHPMFGPDSAKKGLEGLQVAMCPIRIEPSNLEIIKNFWEAQKVDVIQTTPEQHDQDMVYSLALTHTVSKIINGMNIPEITFKTRSFKAIHEVAVLSANDTDQLFHDMLFYNPYFSQMKADLEASIKKTDNILNKIESEQSKKS